jgi:hypothetical protein
MRMIRTAPQPIPNFFISDSNPGERRGPRYFFTTIVTCAATILHAPFCLTKTSVHEYFPLISSLSRCAVIVLNSMTTSVRPASIGSKRNEKNRGGGRVIDQIIRLHVSRESFRKQAAKSMSRHDCRRFSDTVQWAWRFYSDLCTIVS